MSISISEGVNISFAMLSVGVRPRALNRINHQPDEISCWFTADYKIFTKPNVILLDVSQCQIYHSITVINKQKGKKGLVVGVLAPFCN